VKPNPNRSLLKRENLRNLLGGQLFHIVEYENDAQSRWDAQDRLMQQMVLLGGEEVAFRSRRGILKQLSSGINSSSERMFAGAFAGLRRMRQQRFLVTV
jgi:hypothetical protein